MPVNFGRRSPGSWANFGRRSPCGVVGLGVSDAVPPGIGEFRTAVRLLERRVESENRILDAVPPGVWLGLANFGRRSPWRKWRLEAEKPNFGRRSPPIENDRLVLGSVSASVPYYPGPHGVSGRVRFHSQ
jgi:hypothetical protein